MRTHRSGIGGRTGINTLAGREDWVGWGKLDSTRLHVINSFGTGLFRGSHQSRQKSLNRFGANAVLVIE
jgi:hypothetical protein